MSKKTTNEAKSSKQYLLVEDDIEALRASTSALLLISTSGLLSRTGREAISCIHDVLNGSTEAIASKLGA